ncbi:MAG: DUF177 domain-containing protein [Firmicutes bacterium]|nr:DUF177 domain-containing protein [Bacillota bacterium]
MRLNISSIQGRKGTFFQVKRDIPADFVEEIPEVSKVLGPISAELTVTNTGDAYLVTGILSLDVELYCSRCLKPLQTKLEASVEEEFFMHPQELDEEMPFDDDLVVDGDELDATSLIEESILISIPMKAVCSPDCPGLCPTCGAVLAEESCDCTSTEIDLRLAPLSKLLKTTTPERRDDHGSTKEKTLKSKD